jgi:hypothetical protein
MWAVRRGRGEYREALSVAIRYKTAAASAGALGSIHLGDRILGLTHHYLANQVLGRQFAERALTHAQDVRPASRLSFQVETPTAMAALLARILWLQGLPDQATVAAQDAINAARTGGNLFSMGYALAFGSLAVTLWVGALDQARRQLDMLVDHGAGFPRLDQWFRCYAGVLRLRQGNERDTLTASYLEPRIDLFLLPAMADLLSRESVPLPLPGVGHGDALLWNAPNGDALWNAPELLRVDAELLLWRGASDDVAAAEAKLLHCLDIARQQSALSWELRGAISLARLWSGRNRRAEALALLQPVYDRFTEGFETADLKAAKALLDTLS